MTGCAICYNPFNRDRYDRSVRLGYLWDFTGSVGEFLVLGGVIVHDKHGKHGASWRVNACTQCRYDLMGALRRWVNGEFVDKQYREDRRDHDCPCCGYDTTQDARSLRVAGIPGVETLHENFRLEDSVAILTTCQQCRGEFTGKVLCGWLAGEFIADGRQMNQGVRNNTKLWHDPKTGRHLYPARYGWPHPQRMRRVSGVMLS